MALSESNQKVQKRNFLVDPVKLCSVRHRPSLLNCQIGAYPHRMGQGIAHTPSQAWISWDKSVWGFSQQVAKFILLGGGGAFFVKISNLVIFSESNSLPRNQCKAWERVWARETVVDSYRNLEQHTYIGRFGGQVSHTHTQHNVISILDDLKSAWYRRSLWTPKLIT